MTIPFSDQFHVFEKKSQLSLEINDILENRNYLTYFMQFMRSIGKIIILKCWLELEDFRIFIFQKNSSIASQSKPISRTKSFDLDWNTDAKSNQVSLSRPSFKVNSNDHGIKKHSKRKGDCSSRSCENFTENNLSFDRNEHYKCENYGISSTDQAVSLFKKYVALEAPQSVDIPDDLRKSIISNICNPHGQISEDCFKPVLDFLIKEMENKYLKDFQDSPFYIKAQINILTCGNLNLNDVLYNESILFYFTEYLEQESCSLLLEFLMSVLHFRENLLLSSSDPQQAQSDAIIIYEKYFSLQAITPVGFPTEVRLKVESDICLEGGPEYSCFDVPYQIVFKTLTNYVKSFLGSEVYYKYLTEMMNTADQRRSHQRSQSECSSEYSLSTQNTLLAMGDQVFHKKKRNHSVPDMTIDSNQLYNADALWQRKRQDGLSLGRINSLGRFESKFEPDPDKKDGSVFNKVVSRLVPSSSSKKEEEIAWQIAHMIVKDVTDLTMAPPDNDHDSF